MESREGRLRFSGKPRIFAEILLIVGRLEQGDFDSLREQRAALEDLIIYVNSSVDNIWRLRPQTPSLLKVLKRLLETQNDSDLQHRILVLASILTADDRTVCQQFLFEG